MVFYTIYIRIFQLSPTHHTNNHELYLHFLTCHSYQWHTYKFFSPSRGIQQGDPLSPYIFILCMDYLSYLITHVVNQKKWKPIHIGKKSPPISHLLFADDILLFSEADYTSIQNINNILVYFARISGQKINSDKSKLFFFP